MTKMKRFLVIVISALMVVGLAAVIAVNATTNPALTLSSPTMYYDGDREVTFTVSLPENPSYLITTARFRIGFDPTVMSCIVNEVNGTSDDVVWNASGMKSVALIPVDSHLTYLSLVWLNGSENISYTTTSDGTAWLVKVTFTLAGNVPVGTYPLTMSFPETGTYEGNIANTSGTFIATDLVGGTLTINPIPITYTASITGLNGSNEAVYGTTLGASALNITDTRDGTTTYDEADVDRFNYQWYRGLEAIPGATNATYSPTAEDIAATDADLLISGHTGNVLSVNIFTSDNFISPSADSPAVKAVRAPYTGTVPVPVLVSRTTDSITIGISDATLTDSDCQFEIVNTGSWSATPTFSSLSNETTYTFRAQVNQTDVYMASAISDASVGMKVQLYASGTLSVSDTTPTYGDTLTADTTLLNANFITHGLSKATYAWYRGNVASENIVGTNSSYTISASDVGYKITLVITANDDYADPLWGYTGTVTSDATATVERAENTETPTAPSVAENTYVNTDGLTVNVEADQEYKITQGGVTVSDWTYFVDSTVQFTTDNTDWLDPATDYVITTRFRATTTTNAGTVEQTLNVTSGKWLLTTSSLSTSPTDNWVYDTEITATGSTSPTEANASLIYQWYRGTDAIVGANTNKYTPVAADIGNTLKVVLTVGGSYEWNSSLNKEVSGVVGKAAGPAAPDTPVLSSKSYMYVGVYSTTDNEYAITQTPGSTLFWSIGGEIDTGWGCLPNTTYYVYTRVRATDTHNASAACTTPLEVTTDKYPVTGSVTISVSGGGDAEWGKTLTADTTNVSPQAAVPYIIYSWYSGGTMVQSGSGSTYVTTESDFGKSVYVVVAVNDNPYTTPTPLESNSITVLAKTISGTAAISGLAADGAEWDSTLTAVITGVTPAGAQTNITYNWSVATEPDAGTDKATISDDGPTYIPYPEDIGKTLTLTLGGSGSYCGTVTTSTTIVKKTITEKPTVSGSPTFGTTISAVIDAIPADAQTNIGYQWYRSDTEAGAGTAITGATSSTYTVTGDDIGKWLYVAVTVDSANATYRGTTRSTAVEGGKEIITASIGITGSAKYGEELTITIGSLNPAIATYDVVWYRDGVQIKRGDGATLANTKYTLIQADIGTVISTTIIGTGNYTGSPTAAQTALVTKADGPAKPAAPTAISDSYNTITVTGITGYAYKLDSGSWSATRTSDGTFDFTGLSPNTAYSVYCYIPETATHFASVSSDATIATTHKQPISGSVTFTGSLVYGETLTADISNILPAGAQAGLTYAWYRGDTAGSTTELIGVTTSTLTLGAADVGKYIELLVTATGDYTSNRLKISASPVAKANTSAPGTPTLNAKTYNTITIDSVTTNEYAITQTLAGTLSWSDGQDTTTTFSSLSPNKTYYIYARVKETATHNASAACTTPLSVTTEKQPLGGAVTISGSTSYGDMLTAVITGISPADAQSHLTYQWFRMDGGGTVHTIIGATSQTYTITTDDIGCTISVAAIAATDSDYTDFVASELTTFITKKTITGSISLTGSASFGDTLSVVLTNVAPSGSQGTLLYQWQRYTGASGVASDLPTGSWQNISGATDSTYVVTAADVGSIGGIAIQLRVIVTGEGTNYTGSLTSAGVTPDKKLVSGTISITGTVRYLSTVTASDEVLPTGANADMSYRWFLDSIEVIGRTDSTFDIDDSSWIGKTLTVEKYVSATGSYYTGSVASAGKVIGKTANPGTTVPVQVLSFDKTSITIKVTPGQIYSIDGGLTWTDSSFDGVFRGLTPGQTYVIMTKIPGSDTVDDSATLSLTMQTQPDAVNVTYGFYNGITGTVIVPSRVEIGTQATIQVIAPDGYKLTEIFDSMPNGVTLTAIGNDTFTFVAGRQDIRFFIAFTAIGTGGGQPSSVTSSYTYSVPPTVSSKPSSVPSAVSQTSSQTTSTGSDTSVPNMGMSGAPGAASIAIGIFGLLGIAFVVIKKRKIKN